MTTGFADGFFHWRQKRDVTQLEELQAHQAQLEHEFIRLVDVYEEIDPEPVPHVHQPHREKASAARFFFALALAFGMGLAAYLTGSAADWHAAVADGELSNLVDVIRPLLVGVSGYLIGALVFLVLVGAAHMIVGLTSRQWFSHNYGHLSVPPALLTGLCVLLLLLERFPGGLAHVLLLLHGPLLAILEIALLVNGAVAWVAWRRFGETERITEAHREVTLRIGRLQRRLDQGRTKGGPPATVAELRPPSGTHLASLLLAATLTTPGLFAQTVMIDRTGSIANQAEVEAAVVDSVTKGFRGARLRIVLLGESPFSAPAVTVSPQAGEQPLLFKPMRDAAAEEVAQAMRAAILRVLSRPIVPARCTSLRDMLARAALESKPVLLVTDGKNECGGTGGRRLISGARVVVVLTTAKGDPAGELATFQARERDVKDALPDADVLPGFLVEDAVVRFLEQLGSGDGLRSVATPTR